MRCASERTQCVTHSIPVHQSARNRSWWCIRAPTKNKVFTMPKFIIVFLVSADTCDTLTEKIDLRGHTDARSLLKLWWQSFQFERVYRLPGLHQNSIGSMMPSNFLCRLLTIVCTVFLRHRNMVSWLGPDP